MWGWMGYGGGWLVLNWVIWVALVAAAITLLLRLGGAGRHRRVHSPGLDVLEERYARGEIPREEYLQKRSDILGEPPPRARRSASRPPEAEPAPR